MIVVDIEANGLMPDVNEVWCMCMHNTENGEKYSFPPDILDEGLLVLDSNDTIIGHNFIGYDLPVLKMVRGYDYHGTIIDTMILSQLLYPERPGGHSLAAWGERLGFPKVEHEDWSQYSKEMLHRCEVDVELTRLVYETLCNEAGEMFVGTPMAKYNFSPLVKAEEQREAYNKGEVLTALGEEVEYTTGT